jgi:hypothetical protein
VRSQLSVNDQCGRQQTKCQNVPLLKRIIQPAAPAGQQHNRVGEVLLQPGDKFAPLVNVVDQGLSVTHYTLKHNNRGLRSMTKRRLSSIGSHHEKITKNFSCATIPISQCDLSSLSEEFTEEEVKAAVDNTASDKALGSDGYTGASFKAYWSTTKTDLMAIIN